jgi:hypothetical protein
VLLRHRSIPPSIRAYLIIRTSTSQLFSRLRCAASVILRTCHRELQGLPQGTTFKIVLPSSSQILSHYSLPSIVVTVLYFDYIVDMLDMCAWLRMYMGDIYSRFSCVPYAPGHLLLLFRGSCADACFIIQPSNASVTCLPLSTRSHQQKWRSPVRPSQAWQDLPSLKNFAKTEHDLQTTSPSCQISTRLVKSHQNGVL